MILTLWFQQSVQWLYMQLANTIVQVITVIMFPNGFLQFLTEIKCLSFFPICFFSVSLRVPCTSAFQFEIFSDLLCEVSGTSVGNRKI